MIPEAEFKYRIRLVQSRFEWLQLTDNQAAAIERYEMNVNYVRSNGNPPSFWEEKQIESYYFRQTLDPHQFATYKARWDEQIAEMEKELIEQDNDALREIEYLLKLTDYYTNEWIPKLIEHRGNLGQQSMDGTNRKLSYLKDEYQEYLKIRWKEVCIAHFRYSGSFQPNKLKEQQLQHDLEKIYPSYYFFSLKADDAAKAVAKSLVSGLGYYVEKYEQFMDKNAASMRQERDAIYDEFHPKLNYGGLSIVELGANRSEREKLEEAFLSYLLIDPTQYE